MNKSGKIQECTGDQIVRAISYDPSWAKSLKEPLKITTFVNLSHSKITHLSEHLIFCGKNQEGFVATFENCKGLQVPLGKYHGGVIFKDSGLTHIPNDKNLFEIVSTSNNGRAASFEGCMHLLEATGEFPGGVDFSGSGVEIITDLIVNGAWEELNGLRGFSASFFGCHKLKEGAGTYAQAVDFSASSIESLNPDALKILMPNKENVAILLAACRNFHTLSGEFPGAICLDNSGVKEIINLRIQASKKYEKTSPENKPALKKWTRKPRFTHAHSPYHLNLPQAPINPKTKLSINNCKNLIFLPIGFDESNTICEPELMGKLLKKQKIIKELKKEVTEEGNFGI